MLPPTLAARLRLRPLNDQHHELPSMQNELQEAAPEAPATTKAGSIAPSLARD